MTQEEVQFNSKLRWLSSVFQQLYNEMYAATPRPQYVKLDYGEVSLIVKSITGPIELRFLEEQHYDRSYLNWKMALHKRIQRRKNHKRLNLASNK